MMKFYFLTPILFVASVAFCQPANDECSQAERLCPGMLVAGTTNGATNNPGTDHSFCFDPSSTVWYKFTSNAAGGNVTVHFTDLAFDPDITKGQSLQAIFYEVSSECDPTTYVVYTLCGDSGLPFDIVSAVACAPNTEYWVQVNGTTSGGTLTHADANFKVSVSGPGIDEIGPTVNISVTDDTFCQGEDYPLTVDILDCSDTIRYDWYYDGALLLSTAEDTFSTTILADTGDLYLVITCGAVCSLSDTSDTIAFFVTPIAADAGPDKYIADGALVTLEGSGSGTPVWTPATTLSSAGTFTPLAFPTSDETYYLEVTNGPCTATDEVNVFVGGVIQIFAGFTPNNDGINDTWAIGNSDNFPNMEVNVFDRSGQKVFSATNYSDSDKWWNGTYHDKALPTSAYYYVIDLKDASVEEPIFKGVVSIIR